MWGSGWGMAKDALVVAPLLSGHVHIHLSGHYMWLGVVRAHPYVGYMTMCAWDVGRGLRDGSDGSAYN